MSAGGAFYHIKNTTAAADVFNEGGYAGFDAKKKEIARGPDTLASEP